MHVVKHFQTAVRSIVISSYILVTCDILLNLNDTSNQRILTKDRIACHPFIED